MSNLGEGALRKLEKPSFCWWSAWAVPASARISFVSARICCESWRSALFCRSSSWTVFHCWSARICRLASARFWLIITKVERKIASSETIIVSRP